MKKKKCAMCDKRLYKNVCIKSHEELNYTYFSYGEVCLNNYYPENGDYEDDEYDFNKIPQEIYEQVIDAYEKKHGKDKRDSLLWCGCFPKDWINNKIK